jgi:hypothetical protein
MAHAGEHVHRVPLHERHMKLLAMLAEDARRVIYICSAAVIGLVLDWGHACHLQTNGNCKQVMHASQAMQRKKRWYNITRT